MSSIEVKVICDRLRFHHGVQVEMIALPTVKMFGCPKCGNKVTDQQIQEVLPEYLRNELAVSLVSMVTQMVRVIVSERSIHIEEEKEQPRAHDNYVSDFLEERDKVQPGEL